MIMAFRKSILRNPEKQQLIENCALYRTRIFRISDDVFARSCDHFKIGSKNISISFFHYTLYVYTYICIIYNITPPHTHTEDGERFTYKNEILSRGLLTPSPLPFYHVSRFFARYRRCQFCVFVCNFVGAPPPTR